MNPTAARKIEQLLHRLEAAGNHLIIDADTHISDPRLMNDAERQKRTAGDYYHGRPISAEDLLAEMDLARVDMALAWQNPAATTYTYDPSRNAESLLAANRYVCEAAERYPERIIPAGWVDPRACGLRFTLELVDTLVREFGFFMVKLNPAQNQFMMDSPEVKNVVERIVKLGAVPAFHFGADTPYTPSRALGAVASRNPEYPVVAVHMGGGGAGYLEAEQAYLDARALGLDRPNIRYVLSAKRDTHMESDLIAYQSAGKPFCDNLFCGSDAPYGRMAWNFGGFREMFRTLTRDAAQHTDPRVRSHPRLFTASAARNYMGLNFARFAAYSCRRLLETVCS